MENLFAITLRILPITQCYKWRINGIKSISTINTAIMESTECLIIKECSPVIDWKVGVSPSHDASLCFTFNRFEHIGQQRIAHDVTLLVLHLPKSHTEAITRIPKNVTYAGKRNGVQKVSFGWTMMGAVELLRLAKRNVSTLNSEEIKPIALAVIKSQSVNGKFDYIVFFLNSIATVWNGLEMTCRHFWACL